MHVDDHDPDAPGFPDDWLERQRRFWSGWADGAGDADLGAAQAAWAAACGEWWRQVAGSVPEPLGAPLQAALEQTRLCLTLMGGAPNGGRPDPARVFAAALDALGDTPGGEPPEGADADYLRAYGAWVDTLAGIAHAGLERVRARLDAQCPDSPAAIYAVYAEELEAQYREAAASDAFARTVGDLVNARIAMLAARGQGGPVSGA